MIQALIVMLREGLEAALIVGIVLAYLKKIGAGDRFGPVWIGVGAATAVSLLTGGVLFWTVGELSGRQKQLFEGTTMLLAVGVLTWMVFWMRRQARTLGGDLRDRVAAALTTGSGVALVTVSFVAVVREGVESALFMFTATKGSSPLQSIVGASIGAITAVAIGAMVYRGSTKLDLRQFFLVTSVLLFGFAAYLLVTAAGEFGEAGAFGEGIGEVGGLVAGGLYAIAVSIAYFARRPLLSRKAAS